MRASRYITLNSTTVDTADRLDVLDDQQGTASSSVAAGRRVMDPPRDRAAAQAAADEKRPRRRGSGAGSKKSTRRKPSSSSSLAAGPGGERARGHGTDPSSGGGVAARADLATHPDGDAAQRKDYIRPSEPASASRTRPGAKAVRRGSGRSDVGGGEDRIRSERAQGGERIQREQVAVAAAEGGLGGGAGSSVDRAILQK